MRRCRDHAGRAPAAGGRPDRRGAATGGGRRTGAAGRRRGRRGAEPVPARLDALRAGRPAQREDGTAGATKRAGELGPAMGGVRVRRAADAGADPVHPRRVGRGGSDRADRLDDTERLPRRHCVRWSSPYAAGVVTPRSRRSWSWLRKWWDLDVMLPIIGLQPAIDAYRALDKPAEADEADRRRVRVVRRRVPDRVVHCADPVLDPGYAGVVPPRRGRAVGRGRVGGARARSCSAPGRRPLRRDCRPGRLMGVEGLAWLARLEAEWERLRWLAGIDRADAG